MRAAGREIDDTKLADQPLTLCGPTPPSAASRPARVRRGAQHAVGKPALPLPRREARHTFLDAGEVHSTCVWPIRSDRAYAGKRRRSRRCGHLRRRPSCRLPMVRSPSRKGRRWAMSRGRTEARAPLQRRTPEDATRGRACHLSFRLRAWDGRAHAAVAASPSSSENGSARSWPPGRQRRSTSRRRATRPQPASGRRGGGVKRRRHGQRQHALAHRAGHCRASSA